MSACKVNQICSVSLLALSVGLLSCAPRQASRLGEPQTAAPRDLSKSFSSIRARKPSGPSDSLLIKDNGLRAQDSEYLVVKKSALDKEFLLSASLIPQTESPTSSGLQGRVVSFKKVGKKVFLVEATEGFVISPTLPASLILAEIPVIQDKEEEVVLDFNTGMKTVFVAGNWWASDDAGKKFDGNLRATGLSVDVSYLQSIGTVGADNEILEIRQVAQVTLPNTPVHPTMEVRYYLRAYEPNPNYKARESNGNFDHVGYFETPPALERVTGRSKLYYTLHDISKPITYYVSANTPVEYQEAVKEGILYWNKAFGKEVVRAEVAPAGISAPDPTHNLVQWVEFDQAGFAYADALMDPRNGEIKHAQIYLTSAFAFAGRARARALLRLMNTEAAAEAKAKEGEKKGDGDEKKFAGQKKMYLPISIRGLKAEALCDYDTTRELQSMLETVLTTSEEGAPLDDAAILRISQDYIREVTAHEVGHTLGLRHNFAGNLASTYTQQQRGVAAREYMSRANLENADASYTTSSVMEYTDFLDAVLNGALMKARKNALPYDVKAIKYAYLDEKTPVNDGTLFCTDTHADKFLDCTRFDSGKNPLEHIAANISDKMNREAYRVVEAFMAAKSTVAAVDRLPVERVSLDPVVSATVVGAQTEKALSWLGAENHSLSVDRQFAKVDELNKDEVTTAQLKYVNALIKELGGQTSAVFLSIFNTKALDADDDAVKAHVYRVPENFAEVSKRKSLIIWPVPK
jgi:hypothetical protein